MSELTRRTAMFSRTPTGAADLAVDAASLMRLVDLKIDTVIPDPGNPRRYFDPVKLASLVDSVKANGIIQPIVVRPGEDGLHIIVAGERRWRAATAAGHVSIKAIIRPSLKDEIKLLIAQISENENRDDLTTPDLVDAVARLIRLGVSKKQIASDLGMDPSRVTRIAALTDLPPDLAPLLETMGIDPLYELLQQHKRAPEAVRNLLENEPVPTRATIRSLTTEPTSAGIEVQDSAPSIQASTEPVAGVALGQLELAPAQVARPAQPKPPMPKPVTVTVRHERHGQGRVVASPTVLPDQLPVLFEDEVEVRHTPIAELTILAVQ